MKLVYEEGEKELLRELYEARKEVYTLFDDKDPERVYGVSFKVTDPAIAQYVLPAIMNEKEDIDLGIDIMSINFGDLHNREEVKAKLHQAIEDIVG